MSTPDHDLAANSQLAYDLRSAAIDLPRRKIRRGIHQLASRIEQGEPLTIAVNSVSAQLPKFVRQAILVSAQTGDLPFCLGEMARHDRAIRDLRSNIQIPVLYSGAHVLLFVAAAILFSKFVAPEFEHFFNDFDMAKPSVTQAALWFASRGLPMLGWTALYLFAVIVVARLLLGRVRWRLVMYALPGVGPLYRWMGTWQLLNLLKLLVERSVPLPEALTTAATGVTDPNVAAVSTSLSQRVMQGASFAAELGSTTRLANSAAPLVGWGEQHDELPAALGQAADMLEGRMTMQSAWLRTVLPPIITILIAAMALGLGSAIWMPLVSLIQNLS